MSKKLPPINSTQHHERLADTVPITNNEMAGSHEDKRLQKELAWEEKVERRAAQTGRQLAHMAIENFNNGGGLCAYAPINKDDWSAPNLAYPHIEFGDTMIAWGPFHLNAEALLPALNAGLAGETIRIAHIDTEPRHPKGLKQHFHSLLGNSIYKFELEVVPEIDPGNDALAQLPIPKPPGLLTAGASAQLPSAAFIDPSETSWSHATEVSSSRAT